MHALRYVRLGVSVIILTMLLTGLAGCALGVSPYFKDDFSDPASGWGAASHETYVRGYQQGRYLVRVDMPDWFVWTNAGRSVTNVAIETVVKTEQSANNHYGIICRYKDGDFYYFAISSDGYYAIFRRIGGTLTALTGQAMLRSSLIRTDGSDNRLLAVCNNTQLTFFINGEQVAQVEDALLKKGDIGLGAGTLAEGGILVYFDDLEVRAP